MSECNRKCELDSRCKGSIYDGYYTCFLRQLASDDDMSGFVKKQDYRQWDKMTPFTKADGAYLGTDHAHPFDVIYTTPNYHGEELALTCSNGK